LHTVKCSRKHLPELAINASIPKDVFHRPVVQVWIKKNEVGHIEAEVCIPDCPVFFLFPLHLDLLLFRKSGKIPVIYNPADEGGDRV